MKYLPLHCDFRGRRCIIVGGGEVATRRARRLLEAGAQVDAVAICARDEFAELLAQNRGALALRAYAHGDISADCALAVAATDDEEVNRRVAAHAMQLQVPVNVASDAAAGNVIFPVSIERAPVSISVSSAAASPTLAKLLGARIEAVVPAAYGELAQLAGAFRKRAREKIPGRRARIRFWENILQGAVAECVFSGKMEEAKTLLTRALESPPQKITGEAYLIGAGPGDPDLLTLRAHRLLQQADVVFYDRLVSPEILARIGGAELIYVGKRRANHAHAQTDINQMLIDCAAAGKRAARLKGGDPFIFGRGGEEIARLAEAGIAFQVIPGITAATGCACYAGIPLTHRDHAQSVRFVTGQLRDGGVDLDWKNLPAPMQTLVFYMSLEGLPHICKNLQRVGMPAETPAALIEKGTTPRQKIYTGTLATMHDLREKHDVRAPTILIVGEVVGLREGLKWCG